MNGFVQQTLTKKDRLQKFFYLFNLPLLPKWLSPTQALSVLPPTPSPLHREQNLNMCREKVFMHVSTIFFDLSSWSLDCQCWMARDFQI